MTTVNDSGQLGPGERIIDGQRYYSAAWLDTFGYEPEPRAKAYGRLIVLDQLAGTHSDDSDLAKND